MAHWFNLKQTATNIISDSVLTSRTETCLYRGYTAVVRTLTLVDGVDGQGDEPRVGVAPVPFWAGAQAIPNQKAAPASPRQPSFVYKSGYWTGGPLGATSCAWILLLGNRSSKKVERSSHKKSSECREAATEVSTDTPCVPFRSYLGHLLCCTRLY